MRDVTRDVAAITIALYTINTLRRLVSSDRCIYVYSLHCSMTR